MATTTAALVGGRSNGGGGGVQLGGGLDVVGVIVERVTPEEPPEVRRGERVALRRRAHKTQRVPSKEAREEGPWFTIAKSGEGCSSCSACTIRKGST